MDLMAEVAQDVGHVLRDGPGLAPGVVGLADVQKVGGVPQGVDVVLEEVFLPLWQRQGVRIGKHVREGELGHGLDDLHVREFPLRLHELPLEAELPHGGLGVVQQGGDGLKADRVFERDLAELPLKEVFQQLTAADVAASQKKQGVRRGGAGSGTHFEEARIFKIFLSRGFGPNAEPLSEFLVEGHDGTERDVGGQGRKRGGGGLLLRHARVRAAPVFLGCDAGEVGKRRLGHGPDGAYKSAKCGQGGCRFRFRFLRRGGVCGGSLLRVRGGGGRFFLLCG